MTWKTRVARWNAGIRERNLGASGPYWELRTGDTLWLLDGVTADPHVKECSYCHEILTPGNASMDHRIPRSRGGQDMIGNLCLSCKLCNSAKSSMSETGFQMLLLCLKDLPEDKDLVMRKLRASWRVQ